MTLHVVRITRFQTTNCYREMRGKEETLGPKTGERYQILIPALIHRAYDLLKVFDQLRTKELHTLGNRLKCNVFK